LGLRKREVSFCCVSLQLSELLPRSVPTKLSLKDSSLQQHLTTAPLPSHPPHSLHRSQCLTGMLPPAPDAIGWPLMLMRCNCSIRAASRAAGVRPALNLSRPALQPIKKHFAPAVCTRLASTANAVKDGRVHTVIGAVVDGTPKILFLFRRTTHHRP
jgi:hypothetical protein